MYVYHTVFRTVMGLRNAHRLSWQRMLSRHEVMIRKLACGPQWLLCLGSDMFHAN